MVRDLKSPHSVNPIAYFQQRGGHHRILPYAMHGNLKDLWEAHRKITEAPTPSPIWVFTQLTGLARAIEELHASRFPNEDLIHGDLRPENILCFETSREIPGLWRPIKLVITDVRNKFTLPFHLLDKKPDEDVVLSMTRYTAPEIAATWSGIRNKWLDRIWGEWRYAEGNALALLRDLIFNKLLVEKRPPGRQSDNQPLRQSEGGNTPPDWITGDQRRRGLVLRLQS